MKTWKMPHVMIEGFRANEYVAGSCYVSFESDESKLRSFMAGSMVDMDGSESGWWATEGLSSSFNSVGVWNNRNFTKSQTVYIPIASGQEQNAETYGLDLIRDPREAYSEYWAPVTGYWNANGSGSHRWHISTRAESEVNFS